MAERSHIYGMIICAISIVAGLILLVGVLRRSYLAVAIPVMVGSLGALYVAFWIGRALVTTPIEPPADD
jgi:hypothetical protein